MASQGAPSDGIQATGDELRRSAARVRPGWYRGVRLQRPVSPPSIPLRQLQEAVERAIRANVTTLARGGSGIS
jgi:hypothetical protein